MPKKTQAHPVASDQELDPIMLRVMNEQEQGHPTRKNLLGELEHVLDGAVVSFFTSFTFPVMLGDEDADIIAGILQMTDVSRGLILIISSPGGSGLAAERIINVCRQHSAQGSYRAVVPGKAKSAATVVCLGATEISMGPTSELGPIDPQYIVRRENEPEQVFSGYNIVRSYKHLFDKAVRTKGNLEPYLQQLANYDAREIRELEAALELAKDIAVRSLKSDMMRRFSERRIEERIRAFLSPEAKKTHGRPIYRDEAEKCGLRIRRMEPREKVWQLVYELYVRTENFVSSKVGKCIETKDHSFVAGRR